MSANGLRRVLHASTAGAAIAEQRLRELLGTCQLYPVGDIAYVAQC